MVVASSSQPVVASLPVPINPHAGAAERYTMPQLLVVRTGRGKSATTTLPNIESVAAALERPPLYLVRHFQYSLSIQVGAGAQLSGNVDPNRLESLLVEFINTWVLCQSPQCRLPECELVVDAASGPILLHCYACGHVAEVRRGALTKQGKLVKFIRANPPTACEKGTRPAGRTIVPPQRHQRREMQRDTRRAGLPVMVQLQTEGAFESHCRRLGRWVDIDSLQDSRVARTWLDCSPAAATAHRASSRATSSSILRLRRRRLPASRRTCLPTNSGHPTTSSITIRCQCRTCSVMGSGHRNDEDMRVDMHEDMRA